MMRVSPQPPAQTFWLLPAAALMALASLATLFSGDNSGAGVTLTMAGLLLSLYWLASTGKTAPAWQLASYYSLLLALAALAGMLLNKPALALWAYLVPLSLLLVWPARTAALWLIPWLACLLFWPDSRLAPDTLQQTPSIVVVTTLAALFVWLRDYRTQQLAPLRRADALTQASTEEHLATDLYTEIQRSEREGTNLTVLLLEIDREEGQPASDDDFNSLLRRTGRILHEQLRDFDSYYRVNSQRFLLILPYTNSASATRTAEQLKLHILEQIRAYKLPANVSLGMAGLNVGDNADSLRQQAEQALAKAKQANANAGHPVTFNDEHDA